MAKEELKENNEPNKKESKKIAFKCQRCGRTKAIQEMRIIRRFFPILLVCQDWEKEIR